MEKQRLASLDILRGADLFLLLAAGPVASAFVEVFPDGTSWLRHQFVHADWHGFVLWDLIMPLFLFMSGVTIPFSMARYKAGERPGRAFYRKLSVRFCMLFMLGWIVQGNLLAWDWKLFHPFANTLQAIAVGYVAAALLFVCFRPRGQLVGVAALFSLYLLCFVFSGMNLDAQENVAMIIDKAVLGSHRDGVIWSADGSWTFDSGYQYTWILSSLNFAVTVMLGCFTGQLLRGRGEPRQRALTVALTGLILVAAGLGMDGFFPIIKKIWSSSMTLFSGGICMLLTAVFYYVVDVRGYRTGLQWLRWFGMNSIAAYCVGMVISFDSVSASLLYGFSSWQAYPVLLALANAAILTLLLALLYRQQIFLKV